jgi:hypothetical protein
VLQCAARQHVLLVEVLDLGDVGVTFLQQRVKFAGPPNQVGSIGQRNALVSREDSR